MIKFFRHIRKKLIEQNKVRTYFLYGFGEILLVVIGVNRPIRDTIWVARTNDKQVRAFRYGIYAHSVLRHASPWALSFLEEKEEAYDTMDEMTQNLTLPYLTKNGSMKDTDEYGILKGNGRSKLEPRNHLLFREFEFENHMDNQALGISNYLDKLKRLESVINAILRQSNPETLPHEKK